MEPFINDVKFACPYQGQTHPASHLKACHHIGLKECKFERGKRGDKILKIIQMYKLYIRTGQFLALEPQYISK